MVLIFAAADLFAETRNLHHAKISHHTVCLDFEVATMVSIAAELYQYSLWG